MNLIELFTAYFKHNLQQDVAYRSEFVVNGLLGLMWFAYEVAGLGIIFSNTRTVGGWGLGEMVSLVGVWKIMNTFLGFVIWPNTEKFNTDLRSGMLDYAFMQPIPSLLLVSISRVVLWRLCLDMALAMAMVVGGLVLSAGSTTLLRVMAFLVLTLSGILVVYSVWIILIALTFWFSRFDNNVTILQALMTSGRYPASVYPVWLRAVVTFIVPIAVATNVPVQALRGELSALQVAGFLALSGGLFLFAVRLWQVGTRRYCGASA